MRSSIAIASRAERQRQGSSKSAFGEGVAHVKGLIGWQLEDPTRSNRNELCLWTSGAPGPRRLEVPRRANCRASTTHREQQTLECLHAGMLDTSQRTGCSPARAHNWMASLAGSNSYCTVYTVERENFQITSRRQSQRLKFKWHSISEAALLELLSPKCSFTEHNCVNIHLANKHLRTWSFNLFITSILVYSYRL